MKHRFLAALAVACSLLAILAVPALAGANPGAFTDGTDPQRVSLMALLSIGVGMVLLLVAIVSFRGLARRIAVTAVAAIALAGCQTANNPTAWGQIATGAGAIVGDTKIDPQIERISTKLAAYCADVQTAAIAVDILAPANVQKAAQEAKIVVATFCAAPPSNVASALASLAAAYATIEKARRTA